MDRPYTSRMDDIIARAACDAREYSLAMMQEESAELVAAVSRYRRGREGGEVALLEEMVDVEIALAVLKKAMLPLLRRKLGEVCHEDMLERKLEITARRRGLRVVDGVCVPDCDTDGEPRE